MAGTLAAYASSFDEPERKMPHLQDIYRIDNYIDTFALGHYARVLDALDRRMLVDGYVILEPTPSTGTRDRT